MLKHTLTARLGLSIGLVVAMLHNAAGAQIPSAAQQQQAAAQLAAQAQTQAQAPAPTATAPAAAPAAGMAVPPITNTYPAIPAVSTIPQVPLATRAAPPIVDSQIVQTSLASTVPVFGQTLFQGAFAQSSFQGFNPDYQVSIDDLVDVRLWGGFTLETRLLVDSQGNIFIPGVGPIHVANVRNGDLNRVVEGAVKRIYKQNVGIYVSLAAAQPVKVFVSGFVRRPGLYGANSSDSVLHFLDLAGGVDPLAGSYQDIRVLRSGNEIAKVNLYDFMLAGKLPLLQLRDGDSIFVGPLGPTVTVSGLVATPARYEISSALPLKELMTMAGANATATHVRLTHNTGDSRRAEYLTLTSDLSAVVVQPGDEVELVADRLIGEIIVQVEGEHLGRGQYVLPYNATLKDLLDTMQFSPQSLREGLQLYRLSIAARQKQVLNDMLDKLDAAVYSARSATSDEAQLRTQEAALINQFITRARQVQPKGQLILTASADPARIPLEDGDVIRIPRSNPIIAVHGEVYFPSNFVQDDKLRVKDYISMAGGPTQIGDVDKVLVMKPNGEIRMTSISGREKVESGDEVLILPKVERKTFQFSKDIVEILYQTAVAAGVVLRL
ncbi:polysaccharide biosynthesis/export family protein [Hydrocarboniphaga sp.]|uniref:polysaccharide biosynthesis/export family protein n=1 Tax=Hydrocarboniphaga sp. TaxID=2033016 RepID=UPI003D0A723D